MTLDDDAGRSFSPIPFDENRIRAAAVDCSDGRFGEQIDHLLHVRLQLPLYDRLVVPGGAACLAGHFNAYREEEGVAQQLRFLVYRTRDLPTSLTVPTAP